MRYGKYFLLFSLSGLAVAADVKVLEEIVAKVNGDIVTRSELDKGRQTIVAELQARGAKPADIEKILPEKEKDILRDRIDSLLFIQKGKDLSINVDSDISKQLADIQKDAAKTNAALADPDKFQAYVREQTGMSVEDYKSELKNQALTQRVIRQEVGSKINVPKAQVRQYYDEHKAEFVRQEQIFLSEMLISTEGKDAAGQAAAEKKAKDLVARAKKGERFAELATGNSDADSAKQGGFLGAQKKEDLRKEIVDALWDKNKNFVTDPPLKMPNGFLILRLEDRHKAGQADFEEVEAEITEKFYMPLFQPKIREYLTALRQDAFLELKEGFTDSSAAPGKNTKWSDPAQLRPETVTKEEVASAKVRKKRLLWAVPMPGTHTANTSTSTSKN
jgi:parvulin-like peptidyl-prolyl isomerase